MSKSISRWPARQLSRGIACLLFAGVAAADEGRVVARSFIPSSMRREGEVRVVAGASSPSVQVLLYTRSLGRALREMQASEARNWPEGAGWHLHSSSYLATLDEFRAHLREGDGEAGESRPYNLMIEFTGDMNDAAVAMYEVTYSGGPDEVEIIERTLFRRLELDWHYVASNRFLIVQQSFNLTGDETAALLYRATPGNLTKD